MNKQLILDAKLRMKAKALVTAEEAEQELSARSAELLSQVDSVETDEELNKLDESIEVAQRELEAKQLEVRTIKEEIERIEAEIRSINDKQPKPEEGKREKMQNNEKREALAGYIREAEFKQGVTKVDGGALVPVEVLAPHDKKKSTVDLSALVNVVKVNSASGKYPVISKSDAVMVSTDELAKNPELGKPTITTVDYSIATYRGNVAISQEMIDDAAFDIIGKVAEDIKNQELNTKNAAIATVLKTATAKTAQGFDGLKDILNKEFNREWKKEEIEEFKEKWDNLIDTMRNREASREEIVQLKFERNFTIEKISANESKGLERNPWEEKIKKEKSRGFGRD